MVIIGCRLGHRYIPSREQHRLPVKPYSADGTETRSPGRVVCGKTWESGARSPGRVVRGAQPNTTLAGRRQLTAHSEALAKECSSLTVKIVGCFDFREPVSS